MENHISDISHTAGQTMSVVEIENEVLKIAIIPDLGGKVVRIESKKSGSQFLKEPVIDYHNFTKPRYGDEFLPPYASGFDECFPNISPSKYDIYGEEMYLPDHGELWTKSWEYEEHQNMISLWTYGEQLNYRFVKHIELNGCNIRIIYELESFEDSPFDYIWSAHPLLEIEEGDELILPDEINEVVLNWASNSEAGEFGDRLNWPKILGNNSNIDFNYVQNKSISFAAKLFTDRLSKGKAGIYKKYTDESLMFSFNTDQVPFLGIWLCYGSWPPKADNEDYTLALEPCVARPDSLDSACRWDDQQRILPLSIKCWELEISITKGKQKIR